MKNLLILGLLVFTACGEVPETVDSDPELQAFADEIRDLYPSEKPRFNNVPTVFAFDMDYNVLGLAYSFNGKPYLIEINADRWPQMSEPYRAGVVAHELVHAEYGLGHYKMGYTFNGKLMSPFAGDALECVLDKGVTACIQEALDDRDKGELE